MAQIVTAESPSSLTALAKHAASESGLSNPVDLSLALELGEHSLRRRNLTSLSTNSIGFSTFERAPATTPAVDHAEWVSVSCLQRPVRSRYPRAGLATYFGFRRSHTASPPVPSRSSSTPRSSSSTRMETGSNYVSGTPTSPAFISLFQDIYGYDPLASSRLCSAGKLLPGPANSCRPTDFMCMYCVEQSRLNAKPFMNLDSR